MAIDKKIMILEEEFNIRSVVVRKGVFAMCTLGKSIALKSETIGEIRGEERANRSVTLNLFKRNMPLSEIASIVKEPVDTIRKWLSEADNTNKAY